MLKPIEAILWRRTNQATLDSLRGISKGQYDIRLTKVDFSGFFDGFPKADVTAHGGFTITVPIAPFDGQNSVSATELKVRYMGPKSERRDWYIPSQRPDSAYDLWRPGRGPARAGAPGANEFLVIARDVDKQFHARWITDQVFQTLPPSIRQKMQSADAGWILI